MKQRLVKQRLEFSTFLHFNLVKVYACNSISNENYVQANTMCTQVPPQSRARPALVLSLSCIDRARARGTKRQAGLKLSLCMPKVTRLSYHIILRSIRLKA